MKKLLFLLPTLFLMVPLIAQKTNIGTSRITLKKNDKDLVIPYFRNYAIGTPRESITRAIIVIHGIDRNGDDYYKSIVNAAKSAVRPDRPRKVNPLDYTIVISPVFMNKQDIKDHSLNSKYPYWDSVWKFGGLSSNESSHPRDIRVSSFEVVDFIIETLTKNFPNLKHILITGHSAGGQFTNRYMAIGTGIKKLEEEGKIAVEGLVMNPSTYLYMDNKRYDPNTQKFIVQGSDYAGYNNYYFGLEELDYQYLKNAGATAEKIRNQYKSRKVYYLLGANDNDPNSESLAKGQFDMLQGPYRLERGLRYEKHLIDHFGKDIVNNHKFSIVPGVGHSSSKMYKSEQGKEILFGNPDNYCYKVAVVNNQTWMTENLMTTKCSNGSSIVASNYKSEMDGKIILYNIKAVENCNICPDGWQVPFYSDIANMDRTKSRDELRTLLNINKEGFMGFDYMILRDYRVYHGDFRGYGTARTVKGDASDFGVVRCIKK
jgi:hypothetical protein